ncbi:MAG: 2-dehydro-3-deoxygalactonokinase [Symbiopectobacterium sp.]|uniref:2-dehydro-3-deoxygalactonokinase n=1 Tax=Symbiopectobacterium sp. TaxID=2952789 RepID=UPI0039ED8EEA
MFVVIDCGSTNTRLYLIKDQAVISKNEIPVGVNSTAATGNNIALKEGIAAGFQQLLAQENLTLNDVRFAIASGMITSNLGLVEIPHLTAPRSTLMISPPLPANTAIRPFFPLISRWCLFPALKMRQERADGKGSLRWI